MKRVEETDEDGDRMDLLSRQIAETSRCRGCAGEIIGDSLSGFCPKPRCQRIREEEKLAIREGRATPLVYRPTGHVRAPRLPRPRAVDAVASLGSAPRRSSEGADRGNPSTRRHLRSVK